MIAKVTRGQAPSGAVRYLFGPGRENEHTDPHIVAASASLRAKAGSRPDKAGLEELAAAIDLPSVLFGTEVPGGPCWHLALSTKGGVDRDLTDTEWAEVAHEAMRRLGFDAGDAQAPHRWVAVHHGRSGAGNDHVHVVVNLVSEDGKVARTSNDFRQLSRLCADMEARYGLSVLEGRAKKAAMPGLSRAETEKAKRTGRAEAERSELARVVRAVATVATNEAEFVGLLRGAGLAARPRYDRTGVQRVVGYSVAEAPSDGGVAVFFGGGKLARDLSLPTLRARWQDGEARRQEAAVEWGEGAPARGAHKASRAQSHSSYRWAEASARWGREAPQGGGACRQPTARPGRGGWREAVEDLGEVVRRLGAVPAEDVTTWRAVASDTAGALAVLSERTEHVPGPFARASGVLARSAQGPRESSGRFRQLPRVTLKSVAALMAQADLDEDTPSAWGLILAELLRVAQAVHAAHLTRSEVGQAGRLAGEARKALEEARTRLGSLEALRDEFSEVVEAAEGEVVKRGEDAKHQRRRRGESGLRPEELVAATRRVATPKQSSEAAV